MESIPDPVEARPVQAKPQQGTDSNVGVSRAFYQALKGSLMLGGVEPPSLGYKPSVQSAIRKHEHILKEEVIPVNKKRPQNFSEVFGSCLKSYASFTAGCIYTIVSYIIYTYL